MNQNPLADELFAQLQGNPLQQISAQLGVDSAQAQQAVGAALPLLLGALGRNAGQPQGAQALFGALQRDHANTDLGGVLAAALGGGGGGGSILDHIFGQRQQRAELGLGQATGLGGQQASNLLQILAPIVMSFLAQRFSQGGAGAGGLADALGAERQRTSQQGGLGGGLLGAVLDQDGDGKVDLGDLLKLGTGLLGPRR
ncbi:MAG: DUF937 domain-containing protein [Burkholderiales bacterium]|nr:DUF937 domain-containing protein [Burkholderiales bacterium]